MSYFPIPNQLFRFAVLLMVLFHMEEVPSSLNAQPNSGQVDNRVPYNPHQQWINYYLKQLEKYGHVRQIEVQRGLSFNLRCTAQSEHHLRFVTNEEAHPGYYPKARLTYYSKSGKVLSSYTSSSADLVRMGGHRMFLRIDFEDLPSSVYRATLTILEGEGTVLTVFE